MAENILSNIPIPPEKPTPPRSNWRENPEILSILEADPIIEKIIMAESSGRADIQDSPKGARGLMQIMPVTAEGKIDEDTGEQLYAHGMYGIRLDRDELYDPVKNIKFGSTYFKRLRDSFGGNNYDALIAYNWGPENYRKWKAGGKYKVSDGKGGEKIIEYTGSSFKELPKETRDYVTKILGVKKRTGGMMSRNPYPHNPRPI